jgi:hypothetical protein
MVIYAVVSIIIPSPRGLSGNFARPGVLRYFFSKIADVSLPSRIHLDFPLIKKTLLDRLLGSVAGNGSYQSALPLHPTCALTFFYPRAFVNPSNRCLYYNHVPLQVILKFLHYIKGYRRRVY